MIPLLPRSKLVARCAQRRVLIHIARMVGDALEIDFRKHFALVERLVVIAAEGKNLEFSEANVSCDSRRCHALR
jgi:hypothetical protein